MGPVTDVERAFEELQVLRANVADSPGAPLSDELGAVARTYRLWQENALEFVRFLARFAGARGRCRAVHGSRHCRALSGEGRSLPVGRATEARPAPPSARARALRRAR